MVSRLPDPYGDCRDPNDVDKTHNAYAEHFPVHYTAQVISLYTFTVTAYLPTIVGLVYSLFAKQLNPVA